MILGKSIKENKWDKLYKNVLSKVWDDAYGKTSTPILEIINQLWDNVENVTFSIQYNEKDGYR
jgi:hypothetical protein